MRVTGCGNERTNPMNARYVPDNNYDAAIAAILALEPCAFAGRVTKDQIAVALGEFGDIWPEGIRSMVD